MRSAPPRLAGPSAVVLGSVALVVPLVSGVPASAATTDPAPVVRGVASGPVRVAPAVQTAASAALVSPSAARPVTPDVRELSVPDAERPGAPHLAAVSAPTRVTGFGVVGATWQGQAPGTLDLRLRTKDDGTWSRWQELPVHDEHAPDPGTAEARAASLRAGSDPVVVGDVDQVQLRATTASGDAPKDLELSVIDPGHSPADDDPAVPATEASTAGTSTSGPAATSSTGTMEPAVLHTSGTATATEVAVNPPGVRAPRPFIRSRKAWGADERLRSGRPSYGTVRVGFVHHTVNANKYSRAQVPSIIRGIYAYHTQSNGWSDVGYNFLVDRFGRIWQGRAGDVTRNVIGAHTYGFNEVSFAMSAIGNFETARPTRAMLRAYGRLFGWKLGLYGISAGARHRTVKGHVFRAINGHRDSPLASTACPGRYLYAALPAIRRMAVRWQKYGTTSAPSTTPTPTDPTPTPAPPSPPPPPAEPAPKPAPRPSQPDQLRDLVADGFPDLVVRERATDRLQVMTGDGGPGFAARRLAAEAVGGTALITGLGDVTGDGRPDLLVRHPRSGVAKVRPGRANGRFGAGIARTRRFAGADLLAGVGNMVGTRRPDLIARDARSGDVWLYRGQAGGHWGRKHLLIRRAGRLTLLGAGGDLNRDGRRDVVARDGRKLLLYPGTRNGRVGTPRVVARGWGGKDLTVAGQDVTGDGAPDVVARDRATRRTWIYTTQDNGHVGRRFGGWKSWRDLDRLTGTGDVTGDGTPDVLGRTRSGRLVAFSSLGTRWLQGPVDTRQSTGAADFAQVVGDWNGDGYPDVVTRSSANGNVWLYRGTANGGLTDRILMWKGWKRHTDLIAPGDLTGDGNPDLVARLPGDDRLFVFPGDGAHGKDARIEAREFLFKTDLVAAAGFWNNDAWRDLIVRRRGSKDLYLLPGTSVSTFGRPVPLRGGRNFAAYEQIVGVGDFNGDRHPDILARESGRLWLFAGSDTGIAPREYVASGLSRFDLIG